MEKKIYQKIVKDAQAMLQRDAKANNWLWFYDLHIKEVVAAAQELLKQYKANNEVVLIAAWLHDASKLKIKNKKDVKKHQASHHQDSAELAKKFLEKYEISPAEKEQIINCVLRHRNKAKYCARNIEEKIVVVADVLSHFQSVFYFTHFKFHPENSIEDMVVEHLKKIEEDWEDLKLLPKAKKLAELEYKILKKMHKNYLSNRL